MVRLSLAGLGTIGELEERLTAGELALYQAAVELDGPWWGEREAAHLRQLASVQAGTVGADIPPERFNIDWHVGPADAPQSNLLSPADGLEIFAARHGLTTAKG